MQLIIISGRSGSGKSSLLHALEDLGYYAIDNLPVSLLLALVKKAINEDKLSQLAVSIDARNLQQELKLFPNCLEQIIQLGLQPQVIYLNASDQVLIERFSNTRRRHPLTRSSELSLAEALKEEDLLLEPLANLASQCFNTSKLNVHEIRKLAAECLTDQGQQQPTLLFQSFGFKNGVPLDVDLVFDLRCLPNPYWHAELRQYNGTQQPVIDFFASQLEVAQMQASITEFLTTWLPKYQQSNRSYLTLGLGCTGGQHRSVYMAEQLAKHFSANFKNVQVRHKNLSLPNSSN